MPDANHRARLSGVARPSSSQAGQACSAAIHLRRATRDMPRAMEDPIIRSPHTRHLTRPNRMRGASPRPKKRSTSSKASVSTSGCRARPPGDRSSVEKPRKANEAAGIASRAARTFQEWPLRSSQSPIARSQIVPLTIASRFVGRALSRAFGLVRLGPSGMQYSARGQGPRRQASRLISPFGDGTWGRRSG